MQLCICDQSKLLAYWYTDQDVRRDRYAARLCLANPVIPRLSTHFVKSAGGRVLSTHPSLLLPLRHFTPGSVCRAASGFHNPAAT
jgi:hypothetical protein